MPSTNGKLKLGQILAIERNVRGNKEKAVNRGIQELARAGATEGFAKLFTPADDKTDHRAPERKEVQVRASDILKNIRKSLEDLFKVTATKDATNCSAKADVVVDGNLLLSDVPVSHLLFLEKQITVEIIGVLQKVPVLDSAEQWDPDENSGLFRTKETENRATQKLEENVIVVPSTDKHAAQWTKQTKDVTIGTWKHTKFSGALPRPVVEQLQERASKLLLAIKQAREAANMIEVKDFDSTAALKFIFEPLNTAQKTA